MAAAMMSLACIAVLITLSSTHGPTQTVIAGVIAGTALEIGSSIKPNAERRALVRPDLPKRSR
jgi:hypothetical protein